METTTLRAALQRADRPNRTRTLTIARQLTRIVERAHRRRRWGVPLSAESIVLRTHGEVQLAVLPASDSQAYAAPEARTGVSASPEADIYALAAVTFELLTGKRPSERRRLPSQADATLPRTLDPVFERALSDDPGDRYQSASLFMSAFEQAMMPPAAQPPSRLHPRRRRTTARRRPRAGRAPMRALTIVAGAAGVGAGGTLLAERLLG